MTCPNCGHVHTTARKPKAVTTFPERPEIDALFTSNQIDQPEYFKRCKQIGFRDDLRFLIRVAGYDLKADLRMEAYALLEELEQRPSTTADGRQINTIRDRYRVSKGSLVVYKATEQVA